jgi:hypothetical protein
MKKGFCLVVVLAPALWAAPAAKAAPPSTEIRHKTRDLEKVKAELDRKREETERLKKETEELATDLKKSETKIQSVEETLGYTRSKTRDVQHLRRTIMSIGFSKSKLTSILAISILLTAGLAGHFHSARCQRPSRASFCHPPAVFGQPGSRKAARADSDIHIHATDVSPRQVL